MSMTTADELDVDLRDIEPDDPASIPDDTGEAATSKDGIVAHASALAASAVSGLSDQDRKAVKNAAVGAAILALQKRDRIHYTMGGRRWDGIDSGHFARRGDFPRYADCSAFVTWCIYQGARFYQLRDTVNGAQWKAGYTGTMLTHGKQVTHDSNIEKGDAVLYGKPGSTGAHTAICVGGGMVISHGSEAGPFFLPIDYRPDRMQVRRFI